MEPELFHWQRERREKTRRKIPVGAIVIAKVEQGLLEADGFAKVARWGADAPP
jgi:hypothetical protein